MKHYEFERSAFDGLKLYFQIWETEQTSKAVICLVHGLGEHSGRYTHWAELLNQAGYSVITYDLRGHGKSGGNRGYIKSFDEFLKDTDVLIGEAEARYPDQPRFLYGHSLGSLIVCNYILKRAPNLKGVVVTALPFLSALSEQKGKIIMAKVLGAIAPGISLPSGLDPTTISRDPEIVSLYTHDPLVHAVTSTGFGKASLEAIDWTKQHAGEWTLPVLIMHGEKDRLAYVEGARDFSARIHGDCILKVWAGMFHEVHNEPEKNQVFDYLLNWLDGHLSE